jgi:hypothetical protein
MITASSSPGQGGRAVQVKTRGSSPVQRYWKAVPTDHDIQIARVAVSDIAGCRSCRSSGGGSVVCISPDQSQSAVDTLDFHREVEAIHDRGVGDVVRVDVAVTDSQRASGLA